MKVRFLIILLVALELNSLGGDTNQVLLGEWSQSVNGLRSRFIVSIKHETELRRAVVHLELQNVGNVVNPIEFNSGFSLKCQLTNSMGNPPPPAMCLADGFVPPPYWIEIPYDSTLKLRVDDINAWAVARKGKTGVSMSVGPDTWLIPDNATNEYFLTGVFQVQPTYEAEHIHAWNGTILLPKIKIHFDQ